MSQATANIANMARNLFRSAINSALQALQSSNSGATGPTETYAFMPWADTANDVMKIRNAANSDWIPLYKLSTGAQIPVQKLSGITATVGGTATAITATQAPATSGAKWVALDIVTGNGGAAATLAVNGDAAKNVKAYDSAGAKVNTTTVAGQRCLFMDDGTDWVLVNPLPTTISTVTLAPPVRQTVLSGPVDTNGFSAFGGSTGSTTVTAAGTLKPTAAYGADNRTGQIVNPSWTGLSTNGTMYLYLDIAADGACTTGSTTLEPTYQQGGTYSTTNGQNTFNIQEMTMKVGNGTTASQVWRVFVGEVTVAGGVVTAITWHALMGRYAGAWASTLPAAGATVSANHNLGTREFDANVEIKCLTAEHNYSVGDIVEQFTNWRAGTGHIGFNIRKRPLTVSTTPADGAWQGQNATTTVSVAWTAANWAYRLVAKRRF